MDQPNTPNHTDHGAVIDFIIKSKVRVINNNLEKQTHRQYWSSCTWDVSKWVKEVVKPNNSNL